MNNVDVASMFLLGLLGSGHCLGMCGPLILAFPATTGRFSSHLFYHLGRVAAYVLIGAVMGSIGGALSLMAAKSGVGPSVWIMRVSGPPFPGCRRLSCALRVVAARRRSRSRVVGRRLAVKIAWRRDRHQIGGAKEKPCEYAPPRSRTRFSPLRSLVCGIRQSGRGRRSLFGRCPGRGVRERAPCRVFSFSGTGISRIAAQRRAYLNTGSGALMLAMAVSLFFEPSGLSLGGEGGCNPPAGTAKRVYLSSSARPARRRLELSMIPRVCRTWTRPAPTDRSDRAGPSTMPTTFVETASRWFCSMTLRVS